jgi:hypothetical protein
VSSIIVDLIIVLIAGIIGGNAAGKSLPKYDLGGIGNTIAGAPFGEARGLPKPLTINFSSLPSLFFS